MSPYAVSTSSLKPFVIAQGTRATSGSEGTTREDPLLPLQLHSPRRISTHRRARDIWHHDSARRLNSESQAAIDTPSEYPAGFRYSCSARNAGVGNEGLQVRNGEFGRALTIPRHRITVEVTGPRPAPFTYCMTFAGRRQNSDQQIDEGDSHETYLQVCSADSHVVRGVGE